LLHRLNLAQISTKKGCRQCPFVGVKGRSPLPPRSGLQHLKYARFNWYLNTIIIIQRSDYIMKVVVIKCPKVAAGILRLIFKIKKEEVVQ
jgi:hypothetical protein